MKPLPRKCQFAPVFGILTGDFDNDNLLDALLVGNFYGNNPFWGRIDALNGIFLKGNGNGEFEVKEYTNTGFLVPGDAKAIVEVPVPTGKNLILVSQNQDSVRSFIRRKDIKSIILGQEDAWAEIIFKDGTKRKQEFYHGSSYLSQTARALNLPQGAESYKIFTFRNMGIKSD